MKDTYDIDVSPTHDLQLTDVRAVEILNAAPHPLMPEDGELILLGIVLRLEALERAVSQFDHWLTCKSCGIAHATPGSAMPESAMPSPYGQLPTSTPQQPVS